MITCPVCKDNFSDGVKCTKCLLSYCFSCANISESNYRKLGPSRQAAMHCANCKTVGKSNQGQQSPGLHPGSSSTATIDVVLQELRNGIAGINIRLDQLPSIKQDIQNLQQNLHNFEISISDIRKDVNENSLQLDKVIKRVESLESQPSMDTNYTDLHSQISTLSSELAVKDQLLRANNIEIKGIPVKKNENLYGVVCRIGELVGHPISISDINFVVRARSESNPKPIIVGFLGRYVKDNFIASTRSHKPGLTSGDLGFPGTATRIFVNDHLTRDNKRLLTQVKKLAIEKNIKYVWVQNCKILTRRNDTSPIFAVNNEGDLLKLK